MWTNHWIVFSKFQGYYKVIWKHIILFYIFHLHRMYLLCFVILFTRNSIGLEISMLPDMFPVEINAENSEGIRPDDSNLKASFVRQSEKHIETFHCISSGFAYSNVRHSYFFAHEQLKWLTWFIFHYWVITFSNIILECTNVCMLRGFACLK